ncbi:hypothetical protein [Dehalobacter sp. TeCB1]|jgi:hypothetical protein|uniref:hypothetical protein n=1 Tax=Dehalobacter sp. TeCB1 TaxID=1843715 RepID=UPI00083B06EA|nr:hypothetical protein [Dehalobacter sp. TeCB1]OCZ49737.1 hypothetical protein A7D23_02595 [Dehalobacter sp. TeCB1]
MNISSIDDQLENLECEIMSGHLEGINTKELAEIICERVSMNLMGNLTELISEILDEMAIKVDVSYNPNYQSFLLNFMIDEVGNIVELGLQEILFYKLIYQKDIKDAIIATLLYTLTQKYSSVA